MSATRLTVGAEVALEGQCDVSGGLDLSMSDLSTVSVGPECRLRAGGRTALDLSNAELRSTVMLAAVSVVGTVQLSGAAHPRPADPERRPLSQPERSSLIAARGITVDGDLELMGLHGTGGSLRFSNATLSSVVAVGAELDNPDGVTLSLHQATVRGSVVLARGFRSVGLVLLSRATMTGRLELDRSSFRLPGTQQPQPAGPRHRGHLAARPRRHGPGLGPGRAQRGLHQRRHHVPGRQPGPLAVEDLHLRPHLRPVRALPQRRGPAGPGTTWPARHGWPARPTTTRAPTSRPPGCSGEHGYTSAAETILIAQRSQARELITGPAAGIRRALDGLFGASVAYGYRPGRVLWLLVVLLGLVIASLEVPATQATLRATTDSGIVYTTRGPLVGNSASQSVVIPGSDACGGGQVRCFSPVLYAIDTVVPLVNLDQRASWYPDPNVPQGTLMQWWLNLATILGWLLSSIFALSLARLARSS